MVTDSASTPNIVQFNTASVTITQPTIIASAGDNGQISPTGTVSVNYGYDQIFTFTPSAHLTIRGSK